MFIKCGPPGDETFIRASTSQSSASNKLLMLSSARVSHGSRLIILTRSITSLCKSPDALLVYLYSPPTQPDVPVIF